MITSEQVIKVFQEIEDLICLDELASSMGIGQVEAKDLFLTALGEGKQTLSLLTNLDIGDQCRVLEVGVGMGLASTAMTLLGFEVVGIEPGGIGFEKNRKASSYVAKKLASSFQLISESAESVHFPETTCFDLIISNNVMEHVTDVEKSIVNLLNYLSKSGVMIHSCPNYAFPFEPHFGIPLIPFIPRFTVFLLPKVIKQSGLWKSLNFITASRVRSFGKKNSFVVVLRKGTMAKSLRRINDDSEFQKRHRVIARMMRFPVISATLIRIFSLPTWLATPMDFLICHPGNKNSKIVSDWQTQHHN